MSAPVFNTVAWFQVGTDEPDQAKKFFGELFGWTFTPDPDSGGNYDLVGYPGSDGPSGGIARTPDAAANHATFFVLVENVDATVAAAERLGGKVTTPPTASEDGLVFAQILDTSGNRFGVFTPPPR